MLEKDGIIEEFDASVHTMSLTCLEIVDHPMKLMLTLKSIVEQTLLGELEMNPSNCFVSLYFLQV